MRRGTLVTCTTSRLLEGYPLSRRLETPLIPVLTQVSKIATINEYLQKLYLDNGIYHQLLTIIYSMKTHIYKDESHRANDNSVKI